MADPFSPVRKFYLLVFSVRMIEQLRIGQPIRPELEEHDYMLHLASLLLHRLGCGRCFLYQQRSAGSPRRSA